MTKLVEEVSIHVTIEHCQAEGPSKALGGPRDLHEEVGKWLQANVPAWLKSRTFQADFEADGVSMIFRNSGLYEIPEERGEDN